jgi:hypothetical protein
MAPRRLDQAVRVKATDFVKSLLDFTVPDVMAKLGQIVFDLADLMIKTPGLEIGSIGICETPGSIRAASDAIGLSQRDRVLGHRIRP